MKVTKGTKKAAAGEAANDLAVEQQEPANKNEETKGTREVKERINHYKEMGLDSSQVVLKKIASSLGFALSKKGRAGAKAGSRTATSKTGAIIRKKTIAAGKGNGLDFAS